MESTRGNTHSVTFFPPGNVFFGSMISTMHPLTTNTAAVLRGTEDNHSLKTCATSVRRRARAAPSLVDASRSSVTGMTRFREETSRRKPATG